LKSQILHGCLSHKTEAACESITTAKKNNGGGKKQRKNQGKKTVI
jgi:hypothetical protein